MKTLRSTFPSINSRLTLISYVLGTLKNLRGGKLMLDRKATIIIFVSVKCQRVIWDKCRADYSQKEAHPKY